ncbi:MAG TPA: hypothetical protein PKD91_02225, partial [Bacteroidia bacterium]|nr:hypothetical protein [Bacteroidia bacterium]
VVCKLKSLKLVVAGKSYPEITPDSKKVVLEVISGYKSTLKNVDANNIFEAGPCSNHENKVFDVRFKGKKGAPTSTNLNFDLVSIPFYKIFDNGVLFPWNAKTNIFTIKCGTCGASLAQEIKVYPDVAIAIDVPLEFSKSEAETRKLSNSGQSQWQISQKSQEFNIQASYKEDGTLITVSKNIAEKFKQFKELVKVTDLVFQKVQEAFDKTIEVKIIYPSGKLHADFSFKEYGNGFQVAPNWSFTVGLNPLIGGQGTLNLDEAILKLCTGPIGQFYTKIKSAIQKSGADVGLKQEAGRDYVKSGTGITGKVEIDLKSSASFKVKIIISVGASGQAGVKTGFTGEATLFSAHSSLNLELAVKFLGVKYYYEVKEVGNSERKVKRKKGAENSSSETGGATLVSKEGDIWIPENPVLYNKIFSL